MIVARNAFVVDLDEAFELTIQGYDVDNNVGHAGEALRILSLQVQQRDGAAAVNADKLLTQLERILRLE